MDGTEPFEEDRGDHPTSVARTLPNAEDILGKTGTGPRLVAEPPVDKQDKLWSEIDALDDVKKLANEDGQFNGFSSGANIQLEKIKDTHMKLLQLMKERNARIEEKERLKVTTSKSNDEVSVNVSNTKKEHRFSPKKHLKDALYNARNKNKEVNKTDGEGDESEKADRLQSDVAYVQIDNSNSMMLSEENTYIDDMIDIMRDLRT
ncbi:hypothetical protein TPHA_0L01700 [Tetrapisispora phaffii CBS 4417]|uniref:Uncharacterized protein n=1 Tax=Tetrapisispora phaffii (strain ATCC 24235 / CBS 4417 / NBRC 1672 / NRRL Y-8282 / UCD 70-5) TaxID=1071381 RepID=G8C045_TETPH|nr:hypothetical protein TPHA_0L01700 [Tetrapisispora phaffii CBS 4417]CCE65523.1 hypothetical protein TPHA_0L01700 [Tetrapisispora phaffii CBS 4417]